MKKVATIILNRNLPTITDKLFNLIKKFNNKYTDIFIVDSGSLKKINQKKLHGQQIGRWQEKMD